LVVTAPGTVKARIAFNFTVTAFDAFQNIAATYPGAVHFTSSDGAATLPADSTLFNGARNLQRHPANTGCADPHRHGHGQYRRRRHVGRHECAGLRIAVQPADTNVLVGTNVTFSVTVAARRRFAYQWFTNGIAAAGATNATLTVSNITLASATNYYVVITNDWGSLASRVATLLPSGVFNYPTTQNSTAVLNPVTGLYEELITVTNAPALSAACACWWRPAGECLAAQCHRQRQRGSLCAVRRRHAGRRRQHLPPANS